MLNKVLLVACIVLAFLPATFGVALAFSAATPILLTDDGKEKIEMVISLPIYLQLFTPLVTILGVGSAIGMFFGRIKALIGIHDKRIEKLEIGKVDRTFCDERCGG